MLDDRFWTKVAKQPNGCWIWTANKNNKGYGLFRPGGTAPKQLAHRLSYSERFGAIPRGGLILHSCDNPACVNPDHLRIGSHKEKVDDMDTRNRRVVNPQRGEKNANSTVSAETVAGVRRDYLLGLPISMILDRYGVSVHAFRGYVSGRSWAHTLKNGELSKLKAEAKRRMKSNAKIREEDLFTIYAALDQGTPLKQIADWFGVHLATISDIKRRKTWN